MGGLLPVCADQYVDINPQEWDDFTYVKNRNYEYRIVALGCNAVSGSPSTPDKTVATNPEVPKMINFIRNDQGLMVFPNPTAENLAFRLENKFAGKLAVSISDFSGKIVLSTYVTKNADVLNEVINVSNLKSGGYILKISGGNYLSRTKIIKQ